MQILQMDATVAILDIGTERLAIKNRHVDPMPPIKFQLNLTFRSGGDVV